MAKQLRRYSTSFKVILILLASIFGGYFYKISTTDSKQIILADTVAVAHPLKKHKKRHKAKNYAKDVVPSTHLPDTPHTVLVKTTLPKAEPLKPNAAIKPVLVKQLPDTIKNSNSFLYTTYVQPNVTGIVKLREQDNFNSNTLANIPARSKVQVLEKGVTYYKVAYNNNIGFVPKWSLQIK
jgi:hypothetical protein